MSHSLPEIEAEIRRFESMPVGSLRFSSQSERFYRHETEVARGRSLLLQGVIALLVYDLFIVGDYLMSPAHILRAAIVRFAVVTPIAIATMVLVSRQKNGTVREFAACGLCLLATLSIMYLHHGVGSTVTAEAQTAVVLVLLLANCMLRIDVPLAALLTGCVLAMDAAFLHRDPFLSKQQHFVSGGMLMWVAVLTLVTNYMLSREHRLTYLLRARDRKHRSDLVDANAELLALSSTDRLTGLPNRRAYDAELERLWEETAKEEQPLSAIMVDVDHFKRLNDNHGHAYGDRVLQRVASLLEQALRGENDFVARFGGEEFVVLLPGSGPQVALMVAERIRTLVQVAGSPALQQRDMPFAPEEMWSTVSCGVSTAWPHLAGDAASLIGETDVALYRAKRSGRNRVCCGITEEPPSNVTVFPAYGLRT